jgi:hypothetical protein
VYTQALNSLKLLNTSRRGRPPAYPQALNLWKLLNTPRRGRERDAGLVGFAGHDFIGDEAADVVVAWSVAVDHSSKYFVMVFEFEFEGMRVCRGAGVRGGGPDAGARLAD